MKVIQIGESLLNVHNISELELDFDIEVSDLKYYIRIQMSNGNVYRHYAPDGKTLTSSTSSKTK